MLSEPVNSEKSDPPYCTAYIVQRTVYSVQCTAYSVHCTAYIVQCTLYSVQCTVYIVHCTVHMCNVRCTLYVIGHANVVLFHMIYTEITIMVVDVEIGIYRSCRNDDLLRRPPRRNHAHFRVYIDYLSCVSCVEVCVCVSEYNIVENMWKPDVSRGYG